MTTKLRDRSGGGVPSVVRIGVLGVLTALYFLTVGVAWWGYAHSYPVGGDVELMYRAGSRWLAGDVVYDPGAFTAAPGAGQPFLYPPYVLPVLGVVSLVPLQLVQVTWMGALVVLAAASCRRLRSPWPLVGAALIWPPFAESLLGGNLQIVLFSLFVWLGWTGRGASLSPQTRDLGNPDEPAWRLSAATTAIGAVKIGLFHPWLHLARSRRGAATAGALALVAVAFLSVMLMGTELWFEWLAQLVRATDPAWQYGGFALPRMIGPAGLVVVAALAVAVLTGRPGTMAGVGICMVVGAPSLYIFGILFLLPAMLRIRRELALGAAVLVATNTYLGAWMGILLVAGAYAAHSTLGRLGEPPAQPLRDTAARV